MRGQFDNTFRINILHTCVDYLTFGCPYIQSFLPGWLPAQATLLNTQKFSFCNTTNALSLSLSLSLSNSQCEQSLASVEEPQKEAHKCP